MTRHCCRLTGNKTAGVFVRNIVATNGNRQQCCLVYGGLKSGNKGGAQLEQDPSLRVHFLYSLRYKGGARAP